MSIGFNITFPLDLDRQLDDKIEVTYFPPGVPLVVS